MKKLGINNTFRSSSLHISRQHLQRRKSLTIIGLFLWNFNRIFRHSPVYQNCTYVLTKKGPNTRLATASDTVYQLLGHGRWFSPGTPATSNTKTGRHDIAEILLKVALNTKNQSFNHMSLQTVLLLGLPNAPRNIYLNY
jgi:hypothetical protein